MLNNKTLIVDGGEIAQFLGPKSVATNLPSTSDAEAVHVFPWPFYPAKHLTYTSTAK